MSSFSAAGRRLTTITLTFVVCAFGLAVSAHAQVSACGPMDVVFVIDNTGSMAEVNANVQEQVNKIADAVVVASGGDFQFGLISLPQNNVAILADMALGNRAELADAVEELVNEGSCGLPASWDEGLRTAIRGAGPRSGANGSQTEPFNARWREDASKIIILITDTDPSGFECDFVQGKHDVLAYNMASDAWASDIAISSLFVPTGGGSDPERVIPIMKEVARLAGGLYKETNPDASNLADVIVDVIAICGRRSALIVDPQEVALNAGETTTVSVTNYRPGNFDTLFYQAAGLAEGSTVTFQRLQPVVLGTDLQRMTMTLAPGSPPGAHFVQVFARHTDRLRAESGGLFVFVDCKPPSLLGIGQPVTQVVPFNSTATFTVAPTGSGGMRYQWYTGFPGMTRNPITGATGATFTTPAVTAFESYWVRITNVCGTFDSNAVSAIPQ